MALKLEQCVHDGNAIHLLLTSPRFSIMKARKIDQVRFVTPLVESLSRRHLRPHRAPPETLKFFFVWFVPFVVKKIRVHSSSFVVSFSLLRTFSLTLSLSVLFRGSPFFIDIQSGMYDDGADTGNRFNPAERCPA
jgi:hypothetical protein